MINRRQFMAAARPALAGTTPTLNRMPLAALSSVDPVWTSLQYGRDAAMNRGRRCRKAIWSSMLTPAGS